MSPDGGAVYVSQELGQVRRELITKLRGATLMPPTETDLALGATLDERGRPPEVPDWLGSRYRISRVLGRGGMRAVYLATDEALVCQEALKQVACVPGTK